MFLKTIRILGTRGVPATHGGFETFAEYLSLYLVKKTWNVTVYCQEDAGESIWEDDWEGVHLVHIPVNQGGAVGTILFDLKSTIHAARHHGLILTLGYNTAVFGLIYRLRGLTNLFNMDGLEWQRDKWSFLEKSWLYLNERIGCWFGQHLIADHPEIKKHLETRVGAEKITMIPYGAEQLISADEKLLKPYMVSANQYSIVIARPEPENSILEVVKAFSSIKRNHVLLVLGDYFPDKNEYHMEVLNSASDEVIFPGAIYEKEIVNALRFHCRFYIHGHTVGGTNPSLVEAIGAGNAILAHDNKFNRWVAKEGAVYFKDISSIKEMLNKMLENKDMIEALKSRSRKNFVSNFQWKDVLGQYEKLLNDWAISST